MIPKIIHFIWLGNLPIPTTVSDWGLMNPSWKIMIWNEKMISKHLKLINNSIYNQIDANKYNQKSDLLRLEILYRYGGIYVDVDIVCLKPIDTLINKTTDTFFIQEKLGLISNSVIGCTPKNKIILKLVKNLGVNFDKSKPVWKSTGPGFITKILTNNHLIYIPMSHVNYDIKSRQTGLVIFPYYYFNLMNDISVDLRTKKLTEEYLTYQRKNRDNKYKNHNYLDTDKIYGVQLWMGGKKSAYKHAIDLDLIRRNYYLYIYHIKNR